MSIGCWKKTLVCASLDAVHSLFIFVSASLSHSAIVHFHTQSLSFDQIFRYSNLYCIPSCVAFVAVLLPFMTFCLLLCVCVCMYYSPFHFVWFAFLIQFSSLTLVWQQEKTPASQMYSVFFFVFLFPLLSFFFIAKQENLVLKFDMRNFICHFSHTPSVDGMVWHGYTLCKN